MKKSRKNGITFCGFSELKYGEMILPDRKFRVTKIFIMKNHRIDINDFKIEKDIKITVLGMIRQIKENLQITEKLSPKERRSMVSCGKKRNAFVEKIIKVTQENAQLLPRTFNLNELTKTHNITQNLADIIHEVKNCK